MNNILSWLVFGLKIGVIASVIDKSARDGGNLGTIMLGVLGALVGGLLANVVLGTNLSYFNFGTFSIAIIGSLFLLFVQRSIKRVE
ncbi:MAG: GlsB/YeaQ/YmgE family stress response membrane protein [Candidatus Paceibacterales bacterium]